MSRIFYKLLPILKSKKLDWPIFFGPYNVYEFDYLCDGSFRCCPETCEIFIDKFNRYQFDEGQGVYDVLSGTAEIVGKQQEDPALGLSYNTMLIYKKPQPDDLNNHKSSWRFSGLYTDVVTNIVSYKDIDNYLYSTVTLPGSGIDECGTLKLYRMVNGGSEQIGSTHKIEPRPAYRRSFEWGWGGGTVYTPIPGESGVFKFELCYSESGVLSAYFAPVHAAFNAWAPIPNTDGQYAMARATGIVGSGSQVGFIAGSIVDRITVHQFEYNKHKAYDDHCPFCWSSGCEYYVETFDYQPVNNFQGSGVLQDCFWAMNDRDNNKVEPYTGLYFTGSRRGIRFTTATNVVPLVPVRYDDTYETVVSYQQQLQYAPSAPSGVINYRLITDYVNNDNYHFVNITNYSFGDSASTVSCTHYPYAVIQFYKKLNGADVKLGDEIDTRSMHDGDFQGNVKYHSLSLNRIGMLDQKIYAVANAVTTTAFIPGYCHTILGVPYVFYRDTIPHSGQYSGYAFAAASGNYEVILDKLQFGPPLPRGYYSHLYVERDRWLDYEFDELIKRDACVNNILEPCWYPCSGVPGETYKVVLAGIGNGVGTGLFGPCLPACDECTGANGTYILDKEWQTEHICWWNTPIIKYCDGDGYTYPSGNLSLQIIRDSDAPYTKNMKVITDIGGTCGDALWWEQGDIDCSAVNRVLNISNPSSGTCDFRGSTATVTALY